MDLLISYQWIQWEGHQGAGYLWFFLVVGGSHDYRWMVTVSL